MRRWLSDRGVPRAAGASFATLAVAQLAPLVGVWAYGWRYADLYLLYLVEFLLVGSVETLRIAANAAHRVGIELDEVGRPLEGAPDPAAHDPESGVMARLQRWERHVEKPAAGFLLVRSYGKGLAFFALVGAFFTYANRGTVSLPAELPLGWGHLVVLSMVVHHAASAYLHDVRAGERFRCDTTWIVERAYARGFAVAVWWVVASAAVQGLGAAGALDLRVGLSVAIAAKVVIELWFHERARA